MMSSCCKKELCDREEAMSFLQKRTGFQLTGSYISGHFRWLEEIQLMCSHHKTRNTNEIDFESLGNRAGQPYILQTNVFTGGKGKKESSESTYLWFDPSKHFHTFSTL